MSDPEDITLSERIKSVVAGQAIYKVDCSSEWETWNRCNIVSFESNRTAHPDDWQRFTSFAKGDVLIAQELVDGQHQTYGIGVVQAPYRDEYSPSKHVAGIHSRFPELPVWWVATSSVGERLYDGTSPELPDRPVVEVPTATLVQLISNLEEKLNEDNEWIMDDLEQAGSLTMLETIIDRHLPPTWYESGARQSQIYTVVRSYLMDTDLAATTSQRRKEAQERVADQFNVRVNTVQSKCSREIWTEKGEDESYQVGHFDEALKQIERDWDEHKAAMGNEDLTYFALIVENSLYNDEPREEYRFKNGNPRTRQLREAAHSGRFVCLKDGAFIGKGELGEVHLNVRDTEDWDSYIEIHDYEQFDPVPLEAVAPDLEKELHEQCGIVDLIESDYRTIVGNDVCTDQQSIRADIDMLLEQEAAQAALYRQACAHLVAGKNLLLYGPPGTGKTRAAKLLTDAFCAPDSEILVTANAEWSNHQVVGGYEPTDDRWEASPGFLTTTAQRCHETLAESGRPAWLIIDELNRANLDQAFGEVFTLLDLDYRSEVPIEYAGEEVAVPLSFRIIGTINTYDQAKLFSLGYAFRRRFAFLKVNSLLRAPEYHSVGTESTLDANLTDRSETVIEIIDQEVSAFFNMTNEGPDFAPIIKGLADPGLVETLREELTHPDSGFDFLEALTLFAQEVTAANVIDIGQALLIDAAQFVVAHYALFNEDTNWATVDRAMIAYIVPQFEQFMSELRRAETINSESKALARYNQIIDLARALGFPQTAHILERAGETKQILDN